MIDTFGDTTILVVAGAFGGILLGLAARLGRFCTLGAIEDYYYGGSDVRLRMWALAIGIAAIGVYSAAAWGLVPIEQSAYISLRWNAATSIIGGLLFGYGMAMAGNCGYGALARLGGGDLRSFVIVVVMGITTFATFAGPIAWLRLAVFDAPSTGDTPQGFAHLLAQTGGLSITMSGVILGAIVASFALLSKGFRKNRAAVIWSLVVAFAIVTGWIGTGWVALNGFSDQRIVSHTFAEPLGETILYAMTASGQTLSFAVGSVAGVWVGACLGSLIRGHFKWEACEDPRELRRQILGAGTMGVGAALSLGCSIGQGLSAFSLFAYSAPVTLIAIFIGARIGLKQLIEGLFPARLG